MSYLGNYLGAYVYVPFIRFRLSRNDATTRICNTVCASYQQDLRCGLSRKYRVRCAVFRLSWEFPFSVTVSKRLPREVGRVTIRDVYSVRWEL